MSATKNVSMKDAATSSSTPNRCTLDGSTTNSAAPGSLARDFPFDDESNER